MHVCGTEPRCYSFTCTDKNTGTTAPHVLTVTPGTTALHVLTITPGTTALHVLTLTPGLRVLTVILPLQARKASWVGRDCEEGTTKKVPSLKPFEGPPTFDRGAGKSGEGPIKASRGPLDAGHVQEQTPHMRLQVSPLASSRVVTA